MPESVKIIENGLVVTCDDHRRVGLLALLIRNDRIAEISSQPEPLKARYPSAEVIDASSRVVLPGFVDAHYHGESFVLRHWTTSVPYGNWLRHPITKPILSHVHREISTDRLAVFYRLAYFAALRAGVTFVNEFGINNLDLPFLASVEGFRRTDLNGMIAVHNGDQYDRARSMTQTNVRFVISLPNEEDLTTYNMQTALRTARDLKWNLAIHAGEVRHGLEVFRRNFQGSLIQVLKDYRLLDDNVQLIHFSHMDADEAELLKGTGSSVICCPSAAIAKQSIIPPVQDFLSAGIPVALGSDWGSPDPFATMRGMLLLARSQGVRTLTAFDLLSMHTINAARAVGAGSDVGSLEPGKRADLTLVDVSDFRLSYMDSAHAAENTLMSLILDVGSTSVTDVMVGGEFFLRGGHIMTYAEEDLRREGAELMRSLHGLSGESVGGAPEKDSEATPVYPLPAPEPQKSLEGTEEGFRVVRRDEPQVSEDTTEDKEEKPPPRSDSPQPPRRVFGDDDF
jgi:cytosine/adenosine deaminase-related metal-dependent hydrolase